MSDPSTQQPSSSNESIWTCSDCGSENMNNRRFCWKCEKPRDTSSEVVTGEPGKSGGTEKEPKQIENTRDSEDEKESPEDMFVIYDHPADLAMPYSDWIDQQQPVPDDVTYIPRRINFARIIVGTIVGIVVLACIGLILYMIVFYVISVNAEGWKSGSILAVGFVTVSGLVVALLFGAYGLYVSMSAWAEAKILYTRLKGRFRYGLYLGEDALLAWVDREECIGASRSLLKSATTTSRQSGKSTIPVIRVDFIEDTEEGENVEMGCLEFIGDSFAMTDKEVVYTVNKWIQPS